MSDKYYAGIGSRVLPDMIMWGDMMKIARRFKKKGWTLRSGGAMGSDTAFEQGAAEACEIYLAWQQRYLGKGKHFIGPELPNWNEAMKLGEKYHPAWNKLTDGAKALHARNSYIILGNDLQTPVSLVICYTKDGTEIGGTAQGMRMARDYGIPIFNLFFNNVKEKLKNF